MSSLPDRQGASRPATRAPRLSSEARRTAIVEALAPYVLERGMDLSTRDLAAAAGVAEGTLFRVFPDKKALIAAAVIEAAKQHFGLGPTSRPWPEPDPALPLEARLLAVVDHIVGRAEESFRVMTMLHQLEPSDMPPGMTLPHGHPHDDSAQAAQRRQRRIELEAHLASILDADADRLSVPLGSLIDVIRSLAIGRYMAPHTSTPPLSAQGIVDLLLHGAFTGAAAPPSA